MKILVCGGAGYIGSHMVKMLHENAIDVVTFDNLSSGHLEAVQWGEFVEGDLLNQNDLASLFQAHQFDAVMHFSAKSLVGESVEKPELYYQNNVIGTLNLLAAMREHAVCKLVFSSTAAIFGNPITDTINESHPKHPINPYGRNKLMIEQILEDYSQAYVFNSVCLRYFNAAGNDSEGQLGESHQPETHLIPNILKAVSGTGPALKVFGDDYDTQDGTCVRDYIHVADLARAHLLAVEYLQTHDGASAFNLGNGQGFSVKQVIESCQLISGRPIHYQVAPRRAGDPARLVADSSLARETLGWIPEFTDINHIVQSAWLWYQNPRY